MLFQRLRDLREDRDLRQEDVAEILGISQTVYSRYERGFQTIPVIHLLKLADYYKVSPIISWGGPHQQQAIRCEIESFIKKFNKRRKTA